jgi:8-oxo-dGTP diphosphatase/2-hydroxy-dATP diphosphatase
MSDFAAVREDREEVESDEEEEEEEEGDGSYREPFEEKDFTLIFCRRIREMVNPDTNEASTVREILLGMKKRGFGVGKWNGFGGKLEPNESIPDCAKRELLEESGIRANALKRVGYLVFKMLETHKLMRVHVYESWDFSGDIVESEEMRPKWYLESEIPFKSMWADDPYWFPYLLEGKTFLGR